MIYSIFMLLDLILIAIQFIFQYKNIQATKKDVLDALDQYRALSHSLDSYVFNDGSKKELLKLSGTIPVVYKSKICCCIF